MGSGDTTSDRLYQAGVEINGSNALHRFWIEVYPQQNQILKDLVDPGDSVHVQVDMSPTGSTFYLDNETKSDSQVYKFAGTNDGPTQAEWIDERTTEDELQGPTYPEYDDQNTTFTTAEARYNGTFYPITNYEYYRDNMYNCGTSTNPLGTSGSISSGNHFTATWVRAGTSTLVSQC